MNTQVNPSTTLSGRIVTAHNFIQRYLNLYRLAGVFTSFSTVKEVVGKKGAQKQRQKIYGQARQSAVAEARAYYDTVTGRYDSLTHLPSNILYNVSEEDEPIVKAFGAIKQGDEWIVPEGKWNDKLLPWGLEVPEDLRDKAPRLTKTKSGKPVEGYKTPDDEVHGSDSTALPIMYMALPVIGALTFVAMAVIGMFFGDDFKYWGLGLSILTLPYLSAIALSEGTNDAAKSFVLLYLAPVFLSTGLLGTNNVQGDWMYVGMIAGGAFVACLIAHLLFSDGEDEARSYVGGKFEGFKHFVKWFIIYGLALLGLVFLGGTPFAWLQPFMAFGIACLEPMAYANREFLKRGSILGIRGLAFNAASMGHLANAHILPKKEQARKAALDKTPKFVVGEATGTLTKKEYGYAPDKFIKMILSLLDFTRHVIVTGMSGQGKTSSVARRVIAWISKQKGEAGAYVDDGKQSLVNEMRSLMDTIVEPGVPFSYTEGLNAREFAQAINRRRKSEKASGGNAQYFETQADMLVANAATLLEAFVEHEKRGREIALEKMRSFEAMMDFIELDILKAENDLEKRTLMVKLDEIRQHYEEWEQKALKPYKWLWNGRTVYQVCNLINQPVELEDGSWTAHEKLRDGIIELGYDAALADTKCLHYHPSVGKGGTLDNVIEYVLSNFPMMPPETRGGIVGNVMNRMSGLMMDDRLVDQDGIHWSLLEKGVRVEGALEGKIVGPNLPEGEGLTALLISSLIKQRIYKPMKERLRMSEEAWRAKGQKPMLIVWDECQDLVDDSDMELLPKARSSMVGYVFLTQGFDSLVTAFGNKDVAINFANTCASFICMKSSPETYEYFSRRLGTAQLASWKEQTQGIDFHGATMKYLDSPFNDITHPYRKVLRRLERHGSAKFIVGRRRKPFVLRNKEEAMDEVDIGKGIIVNIGGQKEVQPIFKPEEFSAYLGNGYALVALDRAGAPRIDLAKLDYIGPDEFRDVDESQKTASIAVSEEVSAEQKQ